jgi:predicted RecA/RadA family phage recombinase
MSTNQVYEVMRVPVTVTHPTAPNSGDPVRWGDLCGVAITDEGDGGNDAAKTSVDFGPGVWTMTVSGVNSGGASAVAEGDKLYYTDAQAPVLDKRASGYFFGYAMGAVGSAASGAIPVMKTMP